MGTAALAALAFSIVAVAGPIGATSGFEDDDGNLAIAQTGQMDWNGFAPLTWTGSAPYRQSSKTVNGWEFDGLEDAQKASSDTGFAGGTKQDADCAAVIGSSAPNKDDLKRIYIAHKMVGDHVYLELGWVRIPQNSTSSSAHVGFEFNQGSTPCGSGSDGLVRRTAGDMLIVYDFEGGSVAPVLTVRRWITTGKKGDCEVSNDSPPCWGLARNLTASGFAEAKVNTVDVSDGLAPGGADNLHTQEFGEAGIDLTAAQIFTRGCTAFGKAEGVSRSSGNSSQAAMEDLVGPGDVDIENCRPTTTTTAQKITISDFARVTGFSPTGTVTFQLFTTSDCSGTPLYNSGPVALTSGLASTNDAATKPPTLDANATYRWLVSYSGDANNQPSTSACGTESTTIVGNSAGVTS